MQMYRQIPRQILKSKVFYIILIMCIIIYVCMCKQKSSPKDGSHSLVKFTEVWIVHYCKVHRNMDCTVQQSSPKYECTVQQSSPQYGLHSLAMLTAIWIAKFSKVDQQYELQSSAKFTEVCVALFNKVHRNMDCKVQQSSPKYVLHCLTKFTAIWIAKFSKVH